MVIRMEQQTIKMIQSNELVAETLKLKNEGFRLVAITCTSKEGMELSYSFDKEFEFITLRFVTNTEEEIESINVLYSYSFLYENEIKELFGVNIKRISIDYDNSLYIIPVKTPFNNQKEDK